MFSFRTSPIEEQLDKALQEGRVACFCTQNCWNPGSGRYLHQIFAERGNLAALFLPKDSEISPLTNHIDFDDRQLEGIDAVVVEIQDAGARYFNYTRDVMRLLSVCARREQAPAVYVIDHINPAGRLVEGSAPLLDSDLWTPRVPHRHGMTLGELCTLYCNEIGARFPLHIISALASPVGKEIMPWVIAPASDIPGMFSCELYPGGGLWNNTNICPGIGTPRPYEYFGAPFVRNGLNRPSDGSARAGSDVPPLPPCPDTVMMRPCTFTPAAGIYSGRKCYGYQIMLRPAARYHSLMHTLRLLRYFLDNYPGEFRVFDSLYTKLADPVMEEYLRGRLTFDVVEEHIKAEEQKWIRKAKRYSLYPDAPYRIK